MKNFNKVFTSVLIIILLLTGVFIYLNLFFPFKINELSLASGDTKNAELINQSIKVIFNQQAEGKDIEKYIKFDPEVNFSTQTSNKELLIKINQNLKSDTKYKLTLSKELKDKSGKSLKEDKIFEFKTKIQRLIYAKRESELDKIIETDINQNKESILFETNHIQEYSFNKEYLAVLVLNDDETNSLKIKNLKSGEIKTPQINNFIIKAFSISPAKNEIAFSASEVLSRDTSLTTDNSFKLKVYNIDTGELKDLNPKGTADYVTDILYTKDGSTIIYKGTDSLYYLLNTSNYEDLIIIGKHDYLGNVNNQGNKIIFTDLVVTTLGRLPYLRIYNSNKIERSITNSDTYPIDPVFANNSNLVFYSKKYAENLNGRSVYEIQRIDENEYSNPVLNIPNKSLELPSLSPDDKYILVEEYDEEDFKNNSSREVKFDLRPISGEILIYDLVERKEVRRIQGYNPKWIY